MVSFLGFCEIFVFFGHATNSSNYVLSRTSLNFVVKWKKILLLQFMSKRPSKSRKENSNNPHVVSDVGSYQDQVSAFVFSSSRCPDYYCFITFYLLGCAHTCTGIIWIFVPTPMLFFSKKIQHTCILPLSIKNLC